MKGGDAGRLVAGWSSCRRFAKVTRRAISQSGGSRGQMQDSQGRGRKDG